MSKIKPLKAVGDMVIVKVHYQEKEGRFFIPDQAKKYGSDYYGEVISIGPDYKYELAVGDKVAFTRHEGTTIEYNEETYIALKSMHVVGVIDG